MELDGEKDRPHPLQIAAWRAMGSARRTQMGIQLRAKARRWKLAGLRAQHPEWSEERLRIEVVKIYRGCT
jgi:hypothetical protein